MISACLNYGDDSVQINLAADAAHDTLETGKALRVWPGGAMTRQYQSGHIFARGKRRKVWVARYSEPVLENGKVRSVLRSRVIGPCSEMSKSAARLALDSFLRPLNEGVYMPVEKPVNFQEFYEKWERDLLPTYRESTRAFYHGTAARWIQPYFRDWKMGDIHPDDVQRFLNAFGDHYSVSVLKHIRAALRCLFSTAVVWRYLRESPMAGVRLPCGKPVRRATVLTPEDLGRVIAHLGEPYRTMAIGAALTGMRESELFALKWEDFDFKRMVVNIRRRLYRGKLAEPKTLKSTRELPLHPALAAAVRGLPRIGEFVFSSPRGGIYEPCAVVRKHFTRAAENLGIQHFTWRSFRRSAESAMHAGGVPLKAQQEILGHSNPNMTLVYAETNEAGKRGAVEELGKIIFPNLSQVATKIASGSASA
jgi:integrase